MSEPSSNRRQRDRGNRRIVLGTLAALGLLAAVGYGVLRGPGMLAAWRYEPKHVIPSMFGYAKSCIGRPFNVPLSLGRQANTAHSCSTASNA